MHKRYGVALLFGVLGCGSASGAGSDGGTTSDASGSSSGVHSGGSGSTPGSGSASGSGTGSGSGSSSGSGSGGSSGGGSGGSGSSGSSGGAVCHGAALSQASWRDLGEAAAGASAERVLVVGSDVLLATTLGLFRRPLDASSGWVSAGLAGKSVRSLHASKTTPGLLLAGLGPGGGGYPPAESPIWRSTNSGSTWTPVGEALKDAFSSTPTTPVYDAVESLTSYVRPAGGEVFLANASGGSIVRSEDGVNWTYVDGGPGYSGYPCEIDSPPGLGAFVFQGCEAPLDSAWIRRFGVDEIPVTSNDIVVSTQVLGNRRSNVLASSPAAPGALYAGVEGGLLRIDSQGYRWIYESMQGGTGYVYVRTVWVDPCAAAHLVFGGSLNAVNVVLQLYETFDEGAHVTRLDAPASMTFQSIDVAAGAPSPDGRSLVLSVTLNQNFPPTRAHVLVRDHGSP